MKPTILIPALIAGALTPLITPSRAAADLLTSEDRVQMLYSNRFVFDRQRLPLIRVRLMEGQRRVTLGADSGCTVLPTGPNGPRITGGRFWEIKVRGSRRAVVRYWTIVERRTGSAGRWGRNRLGHWARKGLKTRLFEVGSVFAVSGQVVDNRATLVAAEPRTSLNKARRTAAALKRRYGVKTSLHAERVKRSAGTVVARETLTGIQVSSSGMLWFKPAANRGRLTVNKVEYGKGYAWHGRADRQYWGQVYVTVDRHGLLAVVNAVPSNRLLAGLVPAEIYPTAPAESLKAQAVAARGQLLAKLGKRHLADPYLLCASQHCQVYSGAGREHARTTSAVNATRGLTLLASSGRLADTVYHSSCGGHTENNENVWHTLPQTHLRGHLDAINGRTPWTRRLARPGSLKRFLRLWLRSRPKTYCSLSSMNRKGIFRWTVRRSAGTLSRRLGRRFGLGRILNLKVLRRGVSGRATRLTIVGRRRSVTVAGELRIRRLLGNLKSSMFVVDLERRKNGTVTGFVIRGGGWGHGVGMCQMGAIGMAEARLSFRRILRHYYPKTRLMKLY